MEANWLQMKTPRTLTLAGVVDVAAAVAGRRSVSWRRAVEGAVLL